MDGDGFIDEIPEVMSADQNMPPQQQFIADGSSTATASHMANTDIEAESNIEAQHLNAELLDASDAPEKAAAPQKKKKKKKKKKPAQAAVDEGAIIEE